MQTKTPVALYTKVRTRCTAPALFSPLPHIGFLNTANSRVTESGVPRGSSKTARSDLLDKERAY